MCDGIAISSVRLSLYLVQISPNLEIKQTMWLVNPVNFSEMVETCYLYLTPAISITNHAFMLAISNTMCLFD